jgi:hypothetical protein
VGYGDDDDTDEKHSGDRLSWWFDNKNRNYIKCWRPIGKSRVTHGMFFVLAFVTPFRLKLRFVLALVVFGPGKLVSMPINLRTIRGTFLLHICKLPMFCTASPLAGEAETCKTDGERRCAYECLHRYDYPEIFLIRLSLYLTPGTPLHRLL